jgi:hypothetical protein
MTFASNSGFLAIAFMEGSAAFILLILYWLLLPSFPARFFRYWLAGWTLYTTLQGLRIFSLWRGGPNVPWPPSASWHRFSIVVIQESQSGNYGPCGCLPRQTSPRSD